MRPVPTWKSTEAAPTPMSEGAINAPSALSPWQEEHPLRKIWRPSSICAERSTTCVVSPVTALATLKVAPIASRASDSRKGPATLWRR